MVHDPGRCPTACAQYVRMSREHQRFSPVNQIAAIAAYAAERDFEIVRTYQDDGRSGLSLRGRPGLKQLLSDVLSGDVDFSAILVLDVSRWGRFQDPDQAAHYEYVCREAGIAIHYCGEPFENDGTSASTILKHLKRVMAGEYSRELGQKVFAGQMTGARLGFKQGGAAPFGLRRLLIDDRGHPLRMLEPGQRKSLQTDRVILVPGPETELAAIRKIFLWFVKERMTFNAIARRLARGGYEFTNGTAITRTQIGKILRNEIYVGTYTYNKTHQRLRQGLRRNAPDTWVRTTIFEPIVALRTFAIAQRRLGTRSRPTYSDIQLLDHLRQRAGQTDLRSARDVDVDGGPSLATYYNRFGSLNRALELAGIPKAVKPRRRFGDARFPREQLVRSLKRLLHDHGYISTNLINADPGLPSSSFVRSRFGTIGEAYRCAGWEMTAVDLIVAANKRRWGAEKAQQACLQGSPEESQ